MDIYAQLPSELKRCVEKKCTYSWLTALSLSEHGFSLHKGEFRDAVCLSYDWKFRNVPQTCHSGEAFTINHLTLAQPIETMALTLTSEPEASGISHSSM